MTKDLIKRLRSQKAVDGRPHEIEQLTDEAAALIEQQADRIAALEAQIATVAPAVDAQPVAIYQVQMADDSWMDVSHEDLLDLRPEETTRTVYASAPSEGLRKDADLSLRALYEDACIQANKNAQDAERYRWLKERYTGFDFDWMPSEPDADDGKSVAVFNVGREFRGGRDITAAIDAALTQHTGEKDD